MPQIVADTDNKIEVSLKLNKKATLLNDCFIDNLSSVRNQDTVTVYIENRKNNKGQDQPVNH